MNKYVEQQMYGVLGEVALKASEKLIAHLDSEVYINRNTSYAYGTGQPTYDLRNSVTASQVEKVGGELQSKVFHDKEKMSFSPDDFVHGSRYWKDGVTDIRELLPKIINDGLSGDLFGQNQWWQEERPYFSNTLKELESKGLIKKWFKEAMIKRGFNIQ